MKIRTNKPEKGNKFYITTKKGGYSQCVQGKPTDSNCNVLSNCVGYACGRFNEIIGNMKYPMLNCNAENFIERAKSVGLEISDVPSLGGIMVWQKGATLKGTDGAGHVAIVERIDSDNKIYTSESAYGSKAFYNSIRTNDNGRWGIGPKYSFRGCIINPAIGKVTAEECNIDFFVDIDLYKEIYNISSNLKENFNNFGKKEGKIASYIFDAIYYLDKYEDLKSTFSNDYLKAYNHFKEFGIKEGRQASELFNAKYYLENNPDLKDAFGDNYEKAIRHFLNYGINEGRIASEEFNVIKYKENYPDLQESFQDNWKEYYKHYLIHGKNEGRISK